MREILSEAQVRQTMSGSAQNREFRSQNAVNKSRSVGGGKGYNNDNDRQQQAQASNRPANLNGSDGRRKQRHVVLDAATARTGTSGPGNANRKAGRASTNNGGHDRDPEWDNQEAEFCYSGFALKRHQADAVRKFCDPTLGSHLIGDEMRVGKTPTAIALDIELRKKVERKQRGNNCTLIVCPKSAIGVWVHHLALMGISSDRVVEIDLPGKQAFKRHLEHVKSAKRSAKAKALYFVLNWDAVQTLKKELLNAGPWFHIIGDEIHRIKGRDTKRTKAFKRLKAKQLTGLSGTPADNRPEDFWSVLNWLHPRQFPSYWAFVDEYCTTHVLRSGFKKITGVRTKKLPELREKISPYYIRRMLSDVTDSLPQKQYRTITVEMGAKQRREYEEFNENDIVDVRGGDILADYLVVKLTRLQQLAIGCCAVDANGDVSITDNPKSPKLDAIEDLIKDEPELGPFVFLAQHKDTIRLLEERLRSTGGSVSRITGVDSPADRRSAIERFQQGRTDFFVGTIATCREAVDLSRANTIVFVDRAWNPSWNRQAEARADSPINPKPVTIIYLQTRNSIDESRRLRIDQKGRDTDAVISTG